MQSVKYLAAALVLAATGVDAQVIVYRSRMQQQAPSQIQSSSSPYVAMERERELRSILRAPPPPEAAPAYPLHLSPQQRAELRRQLSLENRQGAATRPQKGH